MYPKVTLGSMKESGFRVRVETQLRQRFLRACRSQDATAAQVIRAFMREYVERFDHPDQADLFASRGLPETNREKTL